MKLCDPRSANKGFVLNISLGVSDFSNIVKCLTFGVFLYIFHFRFTHFFFKYIKLLDG